MMRLSEMANAVGATPLDQDASVHGVSIDTRSLQSGDLFVALKGPNFDGHDFILQAKEAGAVAAVVSRSVDTVLPLITVEDTHDALMQMARAHRDQMDLPVVAVTGSCGKTTTRALMESIFSECGSVLASKKSFNNNIGVPLTLLDLRPDHDFAILELGANQLGEISELTALVRPNTSIVTNAGSAHLAGFGSVEGIAQEKGSIFSGLGEHGTAIINQDDHFAAFWHELAAPRRVMTFGMKKAADVMAKAIRLNDQAQPCFQLVMPDGEVEIHLPLLGQHNVGNALAAAAAALAHDLPIEAIKLGLERVQPVVRRLVESKGLKGATIIDDSYNANPHSVMAAIDLLVQRQGSPVLVLGDMLELGEESDAWHQKVGRHALASGVERLYCYGPHSRLAAKAFDGCAYHFEDQRALLASLRDDLQENDAVLVKGSLSMGMNNIVAGLLEDS